MAVSEIDKTARVADASLSDLSTKARIRETALRLFGQHGVGTTSLRSIAHTASMSPGLVVHHFGSKAGLERAVHEEVMRRLEHVVHGVGADEVVPLALSRRREVYESLLHDQPELAAYIGRVLSERSDASVAFFEQSLAVVRSELEAMVASGHARPLDDPEVGTALYWLLVNARFVLRPYLESAFGLDLSRADDLQRLHRAEIDLLTQPLFPLPGTAEESP